MVARREIFFGRAKFQEIAKMTEKPAGLFLTEFSGFSRFAKIRRRTVIVEAPCSICQAAFRYDHVGRGRRRRTCSVECRAARLLKLNSTYLRRIAGYGKRGVREINRRRRSAWPTIQLSGRLASCRAAFFLGN